MDERRYADELIARQAEELSSLRSQAQQWERQQRALQDDLEHRLTVTEREKEESVAALSLGLQRREEEHEEQVRTVVGVVGGGWWLVVVVVLVVVW